MVIAAATFPFMASVVQTSHVEENLCTAFALIFQRANQKTYNVINNPFLHVLFRSGINHYTFLPSTEVRTGKFQREFFVCLFVLSKMCFKWFILIFIHLINSLFLIQTHFIKVSYTESLKKKFIVSGSSRISI